MPTQPLGTQPNMPQSSLSPGSQGPMPPGQVLDDKKKKTQARKRVSILLNTTWNYFLYENFRVFKKRQIKIHQFDFFFMLNNYGCKIRNPTFRKWPIIKWFWQWRVFIGLELFVFIVTFKQFRLTFSWLLLILNYLRVGE